MREKRSTFVVTAVDGAPVLRDVADGQVHTLAADARDHDFEEGEVVEAALAPEPPLEVAWTVVEVVERYSVTVDRVDERPADRAFAAVADGDDGDLVRLEGDGRSVETHVVAVPADETDAAAEDVLADETTRTRAARLGASSVQVRAADGVLSVRYRE